MSRQRKKRGQLKGAIGLQGKCGWTTKQNYGDVANRSLFTKMNGMKNSYEINVGYKVISVMCTKKELLRLSMLFKPFTNEIDALLLLDNTQVGICSTNIITE